MRFFQNSFILLLLASIMTSCNGSKAFVKRGEKMEEVGLMRQAADYYFTAVLKDRSNPDAIVSLQRAGQWVLNEKIDRFEQAHLAGDRPAAVLVYEDALQYLERVKRAGVQLLILESAKSAFQQVRHAHLEALYAQGMEALENEQFDSAQEAFDEVVRLDPEFEDAAKWSHIAYCEPRYRQAKVHFEGGEWRSAHQLFSEVIARDSDFKEAQNLREETLSNGLFTIALLPFENGTNRSGLDSKFRSYVEQALMQSSDPFLEVVDRENQALILQEQQLALSGVLNSNSAIEVGELLGAQTLLKGQVVNCEVVTSNFQREDKQGYESYRVARITEEGKKVYDKKYRPVPYREVSANRQVRITFRVTLISLETGQNVMSEMLSAETFDSVRFAEYGGDHNNVFPSNKIGGVNRMGKRGLEALLNARKTLSEESVMVNNTVEVLTGDIRNQIEIKLHALIP